MLHTSDVVSFRLNTIACFVNNALKATQHRKLATNVTHEHLGTFVRTQPTAKPIAAPFIFNAPLSPTLLDNDVTLRVMPCAVFVCYSTASTHRTPRCQLPFKRTTQKVTAIASTGRPLDVLISSHLLQLPGPFHSFSHPAHAPSFARVSPVYNVSSYVRRGLSTIIPFNLNSMLYRYRSYTAILVLVGCTSTMVL